MSLQLVHLVKAASTPATLIYLGANAFASQQLTGAPLAKSLALGATAGALGVGVAFGMGMSGRGELETFAGAAVPTVLAAKFLSGASWKNALLLGGISAGVMFALVRAMNSEQFRGLKLGEPLLKPN